MAACLKMTDPVTLTMAGTLSLSSSADRKDQVLFSNTVWYKSALPFNCFVFLQHINAVQVKSFPLEFHKITVTLAFLHISITVLCNIFSIVYSPETQQCIFVFCTGNKFHSSISKTKWPTRIN